MQLSVVGWLAVGILVFTALAPSAQAANDAAMGQKLFSKCAICHAVQPGVNRVGPSLAGVFGKPAGQAAGYLYSSAFKAWSPGKKWDAKLMDQWLVNPRSVVSGTKMVFVGMPNKEEREAVIAYLATLK
ncbi:MAG: cytochrome c family protein [Alphaproteobacteria bacterium]|nr:cytochrome c family protein [Alphaproteobacteria bacterium]